MTETRIFGHEETKPQRLHFIVCVFLMMAGEEKEGNTFCVPASSRVHVASDLYRLASRRVTYETAPPIGSSYVREDPAHPRAGAFAVYQALSRSGGLNGANRACPHPTPTCHFHMPPCARSGGCAQAWSMCDRCALSTKLCGPTRSSSCSLRPPAA